MDSGGPFTFGEFPDDLGPTEPEVRRPRHGWLPPEDRLWRHPSELRSGGTGRRPSAWARATRTKPASARWGVLVAGALGTAVAAAGALYVASSGTTPAATATDTSLVSVGPDVAKVVGLVSPSLVTLQPAGPRRSGAATGVVMPPGDLILTAAAAVASGERLVVVSAEGQKLAGQVEGVDARSGVAVVAVARKLTPGSFVEGAVGSKQIAIAACRCPKTSATDKAADARAPRSVPMPEVAMGMIQEVSTGAGDGGPALIDAIEAEIPLGRSAWGSVLLDDDGGVLGVLDGEQTIGGDTVGFFVPAPLALAVADELAKDHRVVRGWLGVMCQDDGGAGAKVTAVVPDSPAAAAGITPGDVVEAVGPDPVSSVADLQARVYGSPPGTSLVVTVVHGGVVESRALTVGAGSS
jgi:S1-C subfamily serine protease